MARQSAVSLCGVKRLDIRRRTTIGKTKTGRPARLVKQTCASLTLSLFPMLIGGVSVDLEKKSQAATVLLFFRDLRNDLKTIKEYDGEKQK